MTVFEKIVAQQKGLEKQTVITALVVFKNGRNGE